MIHACRVSCSHLPTFIINIIIIMTVANTSTQMIAFAIKKKNFCEPEKSQACDVSRHKTAQNVCDSVIGLSGQRDGAMEP